MRQRGNEAHVVIVGGGFAGLYAAYLLLSRGDARVRVTLVEAQPRCGGRARQIPYPAAGVAHARLVAGGAGIGRLAKDRCLRALLLRFGVPWKTFARRVRHVGEAEEPAAERFEAMLRRLKRAGPQHSETFRAFVCRVLGSDGERLFFQLSGFGDDADADAADTLRLYGFDDNVVSSSSIARRPPSGMGIRWNSLAAAIVRWLRAHPRGRVLASTRALRLEGLGGRRGGHVVHCSGRSGSRVRLVCDAVLLALPASGMRALLSRRMPKDSRPVARMLQRVRAQSFAYVYARAADRSAASRLRRLLPHYTVLVGRRAAPLQKMIPMGGGVYMIGYADNANARRVRRLRCGELMRLAEAALLQGVGSSEGAGGASQKPTGAGVRRLFRGCMKRWIAEGTHYWTPTKGEGGVAALPPSQLRAAIRRALPPGLFLAGEALSVGDQGWVEGALRDARQEVAGMRRYLVAALKLADQR